jgi:hypothetical protein
MADYTNVTLDELKADGKQFARTMVGTLREALLELAQNPEAEITFRNKTIRNTAEDRKYLEDLLARYEFKAGIAKYRPVQVRFR